MRDELLASYGHLRAAAGHVVGGTAERLTPPYDRAREMASRRWESTKEAFSPFYEQAKAGAVNARNGHIGRKNKPRSRWPRLAMLFAAGSALGAAGAMAVRRRRAVSRWDEYEPSRALDDAKRMLEETSEHHESGGHRVSSATKKVQAGAVSIAGSGSSQAGRLAGSIKEKSGQDSLGGDAGSQAGGGQTEAAPTAGEAITGEGTMGTEAAAATTEATGSTAASDTPEWTDRP
jgi:hypothetical protein